MSCIVYSRLSLGNKFLFTATLWLLVVRRFVVLCLSLDSRLTLSCYIRAAEQLANSRPPEVRGFHNYAPLSVRLKGP